MQVLLWTGHCFQGFIILINFTPMKPLVLWSHLFSRSERKNTSGQVPQQGHMTWKSEWKPPTTGSSLLGRCLQEAMELWGVETLLEKVCPWGRIWPFITWLHFFASYVWMKCDPTGPAPATCCHVFPTIKDSRSLVLLSAMNPFFLSSFGHDIFYHNNRKSISKHSRWEFQMWSRLYRYNVNCYLPCTRDTLGCLIPITELWIYYLFNENH